MANTFDFVGKIRPITKTEKWDPISLQVFSSGWTNMTVDFNVLAGANRLRCRAQGGKWKNDSMNVVKTMSKAITNEDGSKTKSEKIDIPWTKRFDADQIDKVAGYRRYTVDLGDRKMRSKLYDIVRANKDGSLTSEMLAQVGCSNIKEAEEALNKNLERKREFIAEYDFAEYVSKLVQSEKIKDKTFKISGLQDISYNPSKRQFYETWHVNKIILMEDDVEPSTDVKVDFFFGENCVNDDLFEEKGKILLDGWTSYYDSKVKGTGFKPVTISVYTTERGCKRFKENFEADEDKVKNISLTVEAIDGAERREITIDDLTEDQREDIECGLATFEDIKRDMGWFIAGDSIKELRFKTNSGHKPEDTTYTVGDMHVAREKVEQSVADAGEDLFNENEESLPFDLDDELL